MKGFTWPRKRFENDSVAIAVSVINEIYLTVAVILANSRWIRSLEF